MTTLREAAQQALEALHNIEWHGSAGAWMLDDCKVENAIHALRAALAEPVDWELRRLHAELERCKQVCAATAEAWRKDATEPMAWMDREGDIYKMPEMEGWAPPHTMLYAAPPQRKPLSQDETMRLVNETAGSHWCDEAHLQRIRAAIERAHGIGGQNESA